MMRKPSDYLRGPQLYFDSLVYSPQNLRHLVDDGGREPDCDRHRLRVSDREQHAGRYRAADAWAHAGRTGRHPGRQRRQAAEAGMTRHILKSCPDDIERSNRLHSSRSICGSAYLPSSDSDTHDPFDERALRVRVAFASRRCLQVVLFGEVALEHVRTPVRPRYGLAGSRGKPTCAAPRLRRPARRARGACAATSSAGGRMGRTRRRRGERGRSRAWPEGCVGGQRLKLVDRYLDVDDRLGGKTRHRGRAMVVDATGERPQSARAIRWRSASNARGPSGIVARRFAQAALTARRPSIPPSRDVRRPR